MHRLLSALLLCLLVFPAHAAGPLVLSGGTVIDGYGNPPIQNGVVVIDGDRILAVGAVGLTPIPGNAEVISTEGMTVLPGLWDLQVHLMRLGHGDTARWNSVYGPLAERVVMPIAAAQLLAAGVTSVRDVGAPLDAAIALRDQLKSAVLPGPRAFVSGPVLRKLVPAGTEAWQWSVQGAEDARSKVQRLASAGVDYLLLADVDLWTAEELSAAVKEAQARNLAVHAYAERPGDVERGVTLGLAGFLSTGMGAAPAFPDTVMLALRQRLLNPERRPLSWSPAISGLLNLEALRVNPEPLDDPATIAGLPPLVAADVLGSLVVLDRVTWFEMPASRSRTLCTKLRQLDDARLQLVIGSDSGVPGHLHTRATWQEIDFWVRECGLTMTRAIQAATHDAAASVGVAHEVGTLAPGKIADVIAVRGDLLRHPALLQKVDIVIQRGRRVR